MGRESWQLIEHSKHFYVSTYRRLGSLFFLSVVINMALGLGIYYIYFNLPQHAFYATDGVTAPVLLTAMDAPNETSDALLANDPTSTDDIKVIPQ